MSVHGSRKHTLARIVVRFFAGWPLDGERRTDSTFLRKARRDLTPHQRASRWHHRPGWHRSAWRTGALAVALGSAYGYVKYRTALETGAIIAATLGITFEVWYLRRKFRLRKHMKHTVTPLYQTAAVIVGHPPNDNPKQYLNVPAAYRKMSKPVITFEFPPNWEGGINEQKRLHALFERRLGGDWKPAWYHHVYPPRVEFTPAPAPPDKVLLPDILPELEKNRAGTLVLGYGTSRSLITVNLDSESPHVALSMGTGGGKTSTLRFIIAQLKRQGCERIDIIDPKRVSHNWARNIPGVHIYRTMAEQIEAIHNFRLRMESRYDALDTDPDMVFPRHALVIEEQNSWLSYAQTYWQDYRNECEPNDRARMAKKCPAISDLAYCLFQGRQACMNIISVFQRMSAGASGGGDLRENYGVKLLARCSPQTWRILTGTTMPREAKSRINGRGMFVLGNDFHQIQFAYMRERTAKDWPGVPEAEWKDEAYEYALAGNVPMPENPEPEPEPRITLREAADQKVIPMRYASLRKARTRARSDGSPFPVGLPSPAGSVYAPADLRAWHAARQADRQSRKVAA